MLISRNWLRDFVDIPTTLDPRMLAERFTITTAEVEGIEHATRLPEGVRLPPGSQLDPAELDDWIIEIDNKSITHRPDLWGHYGIARELAAILGTRLRPYVVTPTDRLGDPTGREISIVIDDGQKCPRYTGLVFHGLRAQPSPGWMQVRLARCGMRPIDVLVDLTNYIMLELGQPMHAFDADKLTRIEVAAASAGERFCTLDGVERVLPAGTLMIQSGRKSVAIAGIMGGADTEVTAGTTSVLLESANFDAATIRRAAAGLGLRTEASARFEKSLDPGHTVLGIARFDHLLRAELPEVTFSSRLSDSYPTPLVVKPIDVDPAFAARFIGKTVTAEQMSRYLRSLEFKVEPAGERLRITPPSFRATKDISIEADIIEEISRFVGYDQIEPALPTVTTRYLGQNAALRLERDTVDFFCVGGGFAETHGYIWYEDAWNRTLGFDAGECLTLRNPSAADCSRLRRSLLPGLLKAVERNRHHFQQFRLFELGSVFHPGGADVESSQERHMALATVRAGGKGGDAVWSELKQAIEEWAQQVLRTQACYEETQAAAPWEDPIRVATVELDGKPIGRITLLSLACRQRIDERFRAWSVALAGINLAALADRPDRRERLPEIPTHPRVHLDFSFLADGRRRYAQIAGDLAAFDHPLLRRLYFVDSFEGGSLPAGRRSFTFRSEIGLAERTLTDGDVQQFRGEFMSFLGKLGLELRA